MFIETGYEGVGWIHMAQYMVHWVLCCKCSAGPLGSIKCRKFLDNLSDYWLFRRTLFFVFCSSIINNCRLLIYR
jgi:hypothetical protein